MSRDIYEEMNKLVKEKLVDPINKNFSLLKQKNRLLTIWLAIITIISLVNILILILLLKNIGIK